MTGMFDNATSFEQNLCRQCINLNSTAISRAAIPGRSARCRRRTPSWQARTPPTVSRRVPTRRGSPSPARPWPRSRPPPTSRPTWSTRPRRVRLRGRQQLARLHRHPELGRGPAGPGPGHRRACPHRAVGILLLAVAAAPAAGPLHQGPARRGLWRARPSAAPAGGRHLDGPPGGAGGRRAVRHRPVRHRLQDHRPQLDGDAPRVRHEHDHRPGGRECPGYRRRRPGRLRRLQRHPEYIPRGYSRRQRRHKWPATRDGYVLSRRENLGRRRQEYRRRAGGSQT